MSEPLFSVVFLDQDYDLVTRPFPTREQADEFVARLEEPYEGVEDGFWRMGFTPKHLIFRGTVEVNCGS